MQKADVLCQIEQIENEERRRKRLPLYNYNNLLAKHDENSLPLAMNGERAVHEKQVMFHCSQSQERWIFGGNRTGKTECGAAEAVLWATGLHPFRDIHNATEGWIVSLSTQVQRDVAQRKVLHYLDKAYVVDYVMLSGSKSSPERGIIDYIVVRNKAGGLSKIGFKSCDQGREKFQGVGLDWVWFDEEPPEDIYEECLLRTLDKGGCIWGTMTPLKGRTWVYERIFLNSGLSRPASNNEMDCCNEKSDFGDKAKSEFPRDSRALPDIGRPDAEAVNAAPAKWEPERSEVFHMSWEDNPFLSAKEIKKMERNLSSSALESRKYGRFMEGTGLVFSEFTEENIIEPFTVPQEWAKIVSIDPGLVAPTAVIWLALDGEANMYVIEDYSQAEKPVEHHAKEILAASSRLELTLNSDGLLDAIIDSAAAQNNLGSPSSVAKQFRDCGIAVNTNIKKDVLESITRLKSLFCDCNGRRRLFVFAHCTHLIKELRTYLWGDNQRPVKRNDHCIDALRYAVCATSPPALTTLSRCLTSSPLVSMKQKLMRLNRANHC